MKARIFLLSTNNEVVKRIYDIADEGYEIYCGNKARLMVELYEQNPAVLIVDLDCFEEYTIEMIQSIVVVDYLPVIYLKSKGSKISNLLENEIVVDIEEAGNALLSLIKQASIFKTEYSNVTESYDAIEILNYEVKISLKKYIDSKASITTIFKELLNIVMSKNIFLTNKPECFWILFHDNTVYNSVLYCENDNGFEEVVSLNIHKKNAFQFDIYAVNGFSKNFNLSEMSDINFSKNNLPKEINKYNSEINNFAGFTIGNLTLIGVNYNRMVTNYDVATIKALSINFDFLDTIKTQINELEEAFEYTTNALARAAEVNDDNTGKHIKRVNSFARLISEELGLDEDFCRRIYNSAQMHDVGKIYVDKEILRKPGKLTDEEFLEIKKHPVYGEKIIGDSKYLKMAAEIAKNHHEKYDGSGYPEGKYGADIPLSARIVFIADIYDALRSERPYKKGFTHEEAYKIITEGDGRIEPKNFDPEVLRAFKTVHKNFDLVYNQLKD